MICRPNHDRAEVVAAAVEQIFATAQGSERRQALDNCLREEFAEVQRETIAERRRLDE